MYFGQWSAKTHKPHGKGMFWSKRGPYVGCFENGVVSNGRFLSFGNDKSESFCLGNKIDVAERECTWYNVGGEVKKR